MTLPISIQLYSLREETAADFKGTLEKVASLGYDGVEFAGYGGMKAEELRELLHELGLRVSGAHVPLAELESDLENVLDYHKVLGNRHIICPFLEENDRSSRAAYEDVAARLKPIAEACSRAGFIFSYHNHDFELQPQGGTVPLPLLLHHPQIHAELDVYWLTRAGENPVEWMERFHDKTPLVHLKDMTNDGTEDFAELGSGGIDVQAVIQKAEEIGTEWLVVEQDVSRIGALNSAEKSMNYLKETYLS
ncbi:sugar phosphate isomerase/epimerase family protein [Alkalicoccus urumqiensis]|uniref:Sugar phosphate isomerase/epimerase n=1 Tax=Alkalicoccus urumqiensis TaxID=1548213 RepID=A0A2P6MJ65_ALKUR|nr:sugar phosphate isomerase/epimerase [Alkalicoccus urumqiensis]PRO66324.1 sugar phosphate isomerase/epimerase [Alkalicoccus urumqiensis]